VKDIDFDRSQITVKRGKGQKDRVTPLPSSVVDALRRHLETFRQLHQTDLANGGGRVMLPDALARKYPGAAMEWGLAIRIRVRRCTWGERAIRHATIRRPAVCEESSRDRIVFGRLEWTVQSILVRQAELSGSAAAVNECSDRSLVSSWHPYLVRRS
jgi:integrase